jgi:hypothetical protein
MSSSHSPQVVTNGLVFYYDMGNPQKSWKGAPTTNVIQTNLNLYDKDNGCTVTQLTETLEGNPVYRVVFPAGTLPRIRATFSYTAGQQYTGSIYYKVVSQGSHTPQLIFRENGFGSTYASTSLTGASWQRANITHTFSGSGTSMFLLYQSNSAATTPTTIDFSMPQTEQQPFATPFVNGTRSNTQAVIDLVGNNTITANALTYNADGTFAFDGTMNFLTLATSIDCFNKSYSVEAWIKRSAIGVTHGILGDPQFGWFIFSINSSNKVFLQHNSSAPVNNITGNTNILANTWYHVAATFETGVGLKLYVNGSLDASNSNTATFSLSDPQRGPKYIGRSDTSSFGTVPNYFSGSIESVKGYSGKALTAAEVQQNFNALRSRYGI